MSSFTHGVTFVCSGEHAGSVGSLTEVCVWLWVCQWGQVGALKRGFIIFRWLLSPRVVLFAWGWQLIWVTQVSPRMARDIHHSSDTWFHSQLLQWGIDPPDTNACGKPMTGHQQLKLVLWPLLNPRDIGPWVCSGSYDHPVHMPVLQQPTLTTSMACPCTEQETINRHSCSSAKSKQCPWIAFGYPGFPVGTKTLRMTPVCDVHVKPLEQGCSSRQ